MNIEEFNNKFQTDGLYRTQVMGAVAAELQRSGINTPITITPDVGNGIEEFVINKEGSDVATQLAAADAAITALKNSGVTDLSDIAVLDPKIDPLAWNVVYKDGGWVVNGMQGPGYGLGIGGGAQY